MYVEEVEMRVLKCKIYVITASIGDIVGWEKIGRDNEKQKLWGNHTYIWTRNLYVDKLLGSITLPGIDTCLTDSSASLRLSKASEI